MNEFDIVILPTFAQVDRYKKEQARQSDGVVFASAAVTFVEWIGLLWDLYGDGRTLVKPAQRIVALYRALSVCLHAPESEEPIPITAGVINTAVACVRMAAGLPEFESALQRVRSGDGIPGLSPREAAFARGLAEYADILERQGLVELGEACALLARHQDEVFPHPVRVHVAGGVVPSPIEQAFFSSCDNLQVIVDGEKAVIGQAPDNISVRYAFPAGGYAEPGLLAEIVSDALESGCGPVAIACKDPLGVALSLEQVCTDLQLALEVQGKVLFSQTDFGRAYTALRRCVAESGNALESLMDVLASPFSGISVRRAWDIDEQRRKNRLATVEDVLCMVRQESDTFTHLEELASDVEADVLIGVFEQMVQARPGKDQKWRAEQLAALSAVRGALVAARQMGVDMEAVDVVLSAARVVVSYRVGEAAVDGRRVVIGSQAAVAELPRNEYGTVIAADLTAANYPVADRDEAAKVFLEKLGIELPNRALADARHTFASLVELPTHALVLSRPLFNRDAGPTYPAAVLEEFVDAYRADPSATDDLDKDRLIPKELVPGAAERGEELLFGNARAAARTARQDVFADASPSLPTHIASDLARAVVVPRKLANGSFLSVPCPSPSQVETYLECPYRWFVTRRLRAERLDEEFGPLERGTYAHEVLERFYREFAATVAPKVDAGNLDQARACMLRVVEEVRAEQADIEPGRGRLVAKGPMEELDRAFLERQLVDFLDLEAALLPGFHPAYLEYVISPDAPFEYAGAKFTGTVDRIDVDDAGHAVIVDYKGSVSGDYDIAGKGISYAGKIQTRMYAQAVNRLLGLNVVGAIYVSYGSKKKVSGAFDPRMLDAANLPGATDKSCACAGVNPQGEDLVALLESGELSFNAVTFDTMLDLTEHVVAKAIAGMEAGVVERCPATKDACTYCPVLDCDKRGA